MKILPVFALLLVLCSEFALAGEETLLQGIVQRPNRQPLAKAELLVSAKVRLGIGNPFVPRTPYVLLARAHTDQRGHFRVKVSPPKEAIGFSVVVSDTPRKRQLNGATVTFQATPRFDVTPSKWNVLEVPVVK